MSKPEGRELINLFGQEATTLAVMQAVAHGEEPGTPFGRSMKGLHDRDPIKFMDRLVALNHAFWAAKEPAKWDGKGACPACGGQSGGQKASGAAAISVAEEWLRENGEPQDPR